MAGITFHNVSKIYDNKVVAVNNINLEVNDKEFLVLVGPSGCGKSTILRMIAGLEEISAGDLFIGDRRVNDIPPKERDIAMVFQNYALYPHMNVFDNISFSLKLKRLPKQEIKERVYETAEILGIENLLDRKPKALSGGQRQRVAVGRAIIRNPEVFLFDEPLSNLDAKLRVQMRTEISRLHKKFNRTMVYVTHDQVEAMTMGSRIVVLKDGVIRQIDSPLNIYHRPKDKFVAEFIGSPAMNFIKGEVVDDNGIFFRNNQLKIELTQKLRENVQEFVGKKLTLGIRPEMFSEHPSKHETARIELKLDLIEPMGSEIHLYLSGLEDTVIARVDSKTRFNVGENLTLYFDVNEAHFFDENSKNIIELKD